MMSKPQKPEPLSDEILSAYFDGELSPAQAAQVESWLAHSPESRGKLEEYQRLSGILREMPRSELSSEFAAQVLHQVERQMLLPASSAGRSRWRKARFWTLSVVAPLAATAALFFIMFRPLVPPAERGGGFVDRNPSKSEIVVAEADLDAPIRGAAVASKITRVPAAPSAAASNALRDHVGPAEAASTVPVDDSAKKIAEQKTAAEKTLAEPVVDDGTAARLASLVGGIRAASERGQTSVVRVFVVDRRDGLDLVQLVLEGHRIPRDAPESDAGAGPLTDVLPAPADAERRAVEQPAASGHEALFVVADAEKLQEALRALFVRKEPTLDWKLEEPIDLRRLDSPSQKRIEEVLLALGEAGRDAHAPEVAAGKSAVMRAAAEATGTSAALSSAASRSDGGGLANVKPETQRPAGPAARQFRVVLADSGAQEHAGSIDRAAAEASDGTKEGATTFHAVGTPKRALVRVILVVEPRVPADPPENARPVDEKPGGGAA